jgi:hypothetical protein
MKNTIAANQNSSIIKYGMLVKWKHHWYHIHAGEDYFKENNV